MMDKSTNTLAIIQARMGSSRLPGKMMLPLAGQPVLKLVIERMKRAKKVNKIVLATSVNKNDACLAEVARACGIDVFKGSQLDLVSRFNECIKPYREAGIIVRICADNPFVCPELVDFLIESHIKSNADYSAISPTKGWPDGVGSEVVNREIVERFSRMGLSETEKEHCFGYIWNHPEIFNINLPDFIRNFGFGNNIRIDLNTDADYRKLLVFAGQNKFDELVKLELNTIIQRYSDIFKG